MKKVLSILVMAAVVFLLYAAKMPLEKYRVKRTISYRSYYTNKYIDTTEYFYYADGRICYIRCSQKWRNVTFGYIPGRVLRKFQEPFKGERSTHDPNTDTLILNKLGLAERKTSQFGHNSISLGYDGDRHLIRSVDGGAYPNATDFDYQNGNLVSSTSTDKSGGITNKSNCRYDTFHINTINMGMDFYGAGSKNPLTYCSYQPGNMVPMSYRYDYKYDDKGRIIIQTVYDFNTGKVEDSIIYTYYSGVNLVLDK